MDLPGLVVYATAMSIAPGPNAILLLASSVNHGFRRTIPQIVGINLGFAVQAVLVCAGLGAVFARFPSVQIWLTWIGGAYMLHLAWRVFRMSALQDSKPAPPVSLVEAVLFQYVNPKGWLISVTIGTLFMPPNADLLPALGIVFLVLVTINGATATVWAAFGSSLRRWLADAQHRRIFNSALSAAIVGTVGKMLWDLPR